MKTTPYTPSLLSLALDPDHPLGDAVRSSLLDQALQNLEAVLPRKRKKILK